MQYTDPYRVNSHTQESGSFISASALYDDINMISNINLRNPYLLDGRTQITGSGISMSADFSSLNAPSETLAENARETGSFVIKHILERPSLYGIGDRDTSGWYGEDYYNSTIQAGSQKFIFEVVSGTLLMQTTIFILLLNLVKVCKFNENKENNKKGNFIF